MPEKVTPQDKAKQQQVQQLQAPATNQPSKQMAPPAFQLKADPIQKQDAPGAQLTPPALSLGFQRPPLSLGIPSLQMPSMVPPVGGLTPPVSPFASPLVPPLGAGFLPQSPAGLSPSLLQPQGQDDYAFMQGLRGRLPGVGSLLSPDATLSIWQVDPLGKPFLDADGNARRNPDGTPMTQWSQLGPEQLEEQMRISRMIAERRHLNLGFDAGFNGQGLGASYQWADGSSLTGGIMPTTNKNSTAPGGLDGARLGIDYRF